MLDLKKLSFQHTDLQSTRITRDEADVKSLPLTKAIQQQYPVCLSTDKVVSVEFVKGETLNYRSGILSYAVLQRIVPLDW